MAERRMQHEVLLEKVRNAMSGKFWMVPWRAEVSPTSSNGSNIFGLRTGRTWILMRWPGKSSPESKHPHSSSPFAWRRAWATNTFLICACFRSAGNEDAQVRSKSCFGLGKFNRQCVMPIAESHQMVLRSTMPLQMACWTQLFWAQWNLTQQCPFGRTAKCKLWVCMPCFPTRNLYSERSIKWKPWMVVSTWSRDWHAMHRAGQERFAGVLISVIWQMDCFEACLSSLIPLLIHKVTKSLSNGFARDISALISMALGAASQHLWLLWWWPVRSLLGHTAPLKERVTLIARYCKILQACVLICSDVASFRWH